MVSATISGRTVTVSDEDAAILAARPWRVRRVSHRSGRVYEMVAHAKSVGPRGAVVRTITYLHLEILGFVPDGSIPAWRDGNRLNCTRENLCFVPRASQLAEANRGKTRYPCPFTEARLEELHWTEQRTLEAIAAAAREVTGWGRAPSAEVVKGWLHSAGVRSRTLAEAHAITARKHIAAGTGPFSEEAKSRSIDGLARRSQPIFVGGRIIRPARRGWKHSPETRKALRDLANARPKQGRALLLTCAYTLCRKQFRASPSEKRKYCCQACAAADKRRRVPVPCALCGKAVSALPSRVNKQKHFFCCSEHRWEHRRQNPVVRTLRPMSEESKGRIRRANYARATGWDRKCSLVECRNLVHVTPYRAKKQKTFCCSRECGSELRRRVEQARRIHMRCYVERNV